MSAFADPQVAPFRAAPDATESHASPPVSVDSHAGIPTGPRGGTPFHGMYDHGPIDAKAASALKGVAKGRKVGQTLLETGLKSRMTDHQKGVLGKGGLGIDTLFGGFQHFLGDKQLTDSKAGHAGVSALKTAGDLGVGLAKKGLDKTAAPTGLGTGPGLAVAIADSFIPEDHGAKVITHVAQEADPFTQAKKAIGGGVDAGTAGVSYLQGNHAKAFQQADAVEENAVAGKYSAVTQALTYAVNGDAREMAVDHKAERGERGILNSYANVIADSASELAHGKNEEGRTHDARTYEAELEAMRWYKPWTW